MKNLYEVLGVAKDATQEVIRSSYRKLAQQLHPDRETGDRGKFQELQHAYDVVSNPEKRAHYDRTGEDSGPPNYKAMATANLLQVFGGVLSLSLEGDIIERCSAAVKTGIESLLAKQSKLVKDEAKLTKYRARVTRKDGGESLFTMVADAKLADVRRVMESVKHEIAITEIMLTLLDEHEDTAPEHDCVNEQVLRELFAGLGQKHSFFNTGTV